MSLTALSVGVLGGDLSSCPPTQPQRTLLEPVTWGALSMDEAGVWLLEVKTKAERAVHPSSEPGQVGSLSFNSLELFESSERQVT